MYFGFRFQKLFSAAAAAALLLCALFGGGAAIRAAVSAPDVVSLPVLMYHSVCDNRRAGGEYVLPPEKFRADMEYLRRRGYAAVFLSEVRDYAQNGAPLPDKPVVITLDDGFLNNLTEVLPVLEELDMKAEINLVGEFVLREETAVYRSPAYSYLNKEEIAALRESGRIEFGSHTYALHTLKGRQGCAGAPGESAEQYEKLLRADARRMRETVLSPCGIETEIFAYPFGAKSDATPAILQSEGFAILLTCEEKINRVAPGGDLTAVCRINRPASMTTAAFMEKFGL